MDNSRVQQNLSAKELTREIDQATNVANGWQGLSEGPSIDDGRNLGQGQVVRPEQWGAAIEIARDEAELMHPEAFVGDETEVQMQEHLADEAENLRNENDPKRDFEAKIVNNSQARIAEVAIREVEKITSGSFSPAEVVRLRHELGNKMMRSFENPHDLIKEAA